MKILIFFLALLCWGGYKVYLHYAGTPESNRRKEICRDFDTARWAATAEKYGLDVHRAQCKIINNLQAQLRGRDIYAVGMVDNGLDRVWSGTVRFWGGDIGDHTFNLDNMQPGEKRNIDEHLGSMSSNVTHYRVELIEKP